MKFKKIHANIITVVLFFAILVPVLLTVDFPDKAIVILSDEDFQKYGFPGNGTANNPFRIEGLKLTNEPKNNIYYAITIRGTSNHFIIQNCIIRDYSGGIYLYNVVNSTAKILNNQIEECGEYTGINIFQSYNVQIINNSISQAEEAIYLSKSDHSLIINNTIYHNRVGIWISYSDNVEISMNNCSFNRYGITIENSQFTKILNNIICSNFEWDESIWSQGEGMTISFCFYLQILNNTIKNNARYGILSQNLLHSNISFNDISYTTLAIEHGLGLFLFHSSNNSITYNLIEENRKYGVYFEDSRDNIFHHNAFIQNGINVEDNAFSQFGYNNTWFDNITLEGNYWFGWNTSLPYIIQEELTEDPYPLDYNPVVLDLFFPLFFS